MLNHAAATDVVFSKEEVMDYEKLEQRMRCLQTCFELARQHPHSAMPEWITDVVFEMLMELDEAKNKAHHSKGNNDERN